MQKNFLFGNHTDVSESLHLSPISFQSPPDEGDRDQ